MFKAIDDCYELNFSKPYFLFSFLFCFIHINPNSFSPHPRCTKRQEHCSSLSSSQTHRSNTKSYFQPHR